MGKKLKILLIEGRARQVLSIAKSLRTLGQDVTTYNSSRFDYGYTSRYPNHKVLTKMDWDHKDSIYHDLLDHIKSNAYDLVIPMNDDIAIILSEHKQVFGQFATIEVNDWEIFKIAMDKYQTMKKCMDNDIPCPKTFFDWVSFKENVNSLAFPIVVKPRTGCGAVGFHISNEFSELTEYYKHAIEKYGPCLIQEYIPQTDLQYKAELFIDKNGVVKSAIVFAKVRWYPINGGSSTLNVTVLRPDIVESCIKLLKIINWRGYADIDLIQDPRDNTAKVIEINPRITGSVKICSKAGVDFSQQIVENCLGDEVTEMMNYKVGVYLRYLQKDVLWFLKSKNRFKVKPSWFNFKNSSDQIFDISDPLPFFMSSFNGVNKLLEDSKKRKV